MSTNMADRVKRLFEAGQLSGHSVKFYDGTYKWDSEGFENEHGGKCRRTRVLTRSLDRPAVSSAEIAFR
jgi:hypothetical protein